LKLPSLRLVGPIRSLRSAWAWGFTGLALAPGAPLGLWIYFRFAGIPSSGEVARTALIYSAVMTALVFTSFGFAVGWLMDRLRSAALHDGLTGLFNRRFLRESLPQLQASSSRRGAPLCLIMLDLDHFKRVNDTYGHLVGDRTLRAVSEALRESSRRADLIARYGGEEFAVLCPDTDCETGLHVAERLRAAVEALDETVLGHPGPQTISLGVAVQTRDHELTPEQLIDQADVAMYEAKHRGRNRAIAWLDGQEYVRG
jgi:diguanylate cyclase (GGDEF)-like protein